ncbi:hypothetical protein M2651_08575 [Clostridium sp. SYSU_GA19001]|uniref:hypothetical protein n=1 Tax=Clostridium caldaquaticum TaxID=2940653 RepID=UPI0020772330|nr:hypothetical protein [Clostridium caldaquaticum]MCM8711081.1 hypothetical protein [Clostridium caldaquaticum]
MKMRKNTAMIISFAVGTMLFATTAFAEAVSKSGYDQFKDSIKYSADVITSTSMVSSYTVDISYVLKDNGKEVSSSNSVNKYDLKNNSCINTTTTTEGSTKTESVFYRDKSGYINYNSNDGVYHVIEKDMSKEETWLKNPFKEKEAADLEKIADALVGSLKDSVVVSENSDGSKIISGSLSETQIPSLINAVVSYQFKSRYSWYENNSNNKSAVPQITQDVFVKEVKGNAVVDKNGLIQSVLATGVLHGKDDQGKEHDLTFDFLSKLSNVNSTTVNKPDISGKKVQKSADYGESYKNTKPELYVGTYKNNIVIEKDGKFQKIGERIVDIEKIDKNTASGRYHEEYLKGYEEYAASAKDFKFEAKFKDFPYSAEFNKVGSSDKSTSGYFGLVPYSACINFTFMQSYEVYNSVFDRVFN